MIPTIQMLPNPMFPFYNFYGTQGFQYIPLTSSTNYSWSQNPFLPYFPFNYAPNESVQEKSLFAFNNDKTIQFSYEKQTLLQSNPKNLSKLTKCDQFAHHYKNNLSTNSTQGCEEIRTRALNYKNRIMRISQNKNRNIIPSVVQQIFSFISKPNKSKSIATKIFSLQEHSQSFTPTIQKYFYFVKQIKQKLNHYLNANSLSALCQIQEHCLQLISKQQQQFYLKIARCVAKYFTDNQLPLLIIHSKRMFQDKRIQHMKVRRLLVEVLQNIDY